MVPPHAKPAQVLAFGAVILMMASKGAVTFIGSAMPNSILVSGFVYVWKQILEVASQLALEATCCAVAARSISRCRRAEHEGRLTEAG